MQQTATLNAYFRKKKLISKSLKDNVYSNLFVYNIYKIIYINLFSCQVFLLESKYY